MNYLFLIITLAIIFIVLGIATFTNLTLTDEQYDRLKLIVSKWHYIVVFIALVVKTFDVQYGIETVTIVSGFGAMLAGLMDISINNYDGEKVSVLYNEDLLKDMLGFDEELHLMGQLESEEDEEEPEEDEEELEEDEESED